jgi:hypothetical protein
MSSIIDWLLQGDVSLQYLTHKYLLNTEENYLRNLQARITSEGWGKQFLEARNPSGHWGLWFYQPKWTCTHYTLLEMKDLGMPRDVAACREMVIRALDECMLESGGVNFAKSKVRADVAVNGMILNYAAYFCPDEERVNKLAGYFLNQAKADGGYGWDPESEYSDPHTTICVLEGLSEYRKAGFTKHVDRIRQSEKTAIEQLLSKLLLITEDQRFKLLSYPYRYRYDLLRALEYLATNNTPYDGRMAPALWWLEDKQAESGFWYLENIHPGNRHFPMEAKGEPSRFITLKALIVRRIYQGSVSLNSIIDQ